jgi:ABC-2 type transport system permease protein
MFFRSVYLKTLRGFRVPILGWGVGMGLLLAVVVTAIESLVATPQARASLVSLGASFAWIAEPIKIDTPGGYVTWKYGFTILIVAIWPILALTGLFRGEEERGSMDVLLTLPRTRIRVAVEKVAAMWTALLVMGVIIGVLAYAGGAKVNADFTLSDTLLFGINLVAICGVFGGIALLLAQFFSERRTAAGATAAVLFVSIVLDMVHRVVHNADWVSQLSPVYYFNLSKPLIPSYGTNFGAMLLLLSLTVILSGAGIYLFARRDIAGVVALPWARRLPQRAARPQPELLPGGWSVRSLYARSLGMVAPSAGWWTLAIAGFAGWMVVVVKQTSADLYKLLQGSSVLKEIFKLSGGQAELNASILSGIFIFMPLLLMAFAVTQANRWSADEEDGRLELVLATPQPRLKVILVRFAALSTATIVISLITLAVTELAASAEGVALDASHVVAASLSMIPLALLVAAVGYLFSGWLRAAVDTGLLSFLLVIWFVISFIGPGLSWPDATLRLSAFYYYGTPLLDGAQLTSLLGMLAVSAAALALSSYRFVRKDIGV